MPIDQPTIDLEKEINSIYHKALMDDARFLILYGGAGSGKSYFAAQKVIIRTISNEPHIYVCTRKVGETLRNSVFAVLKAIISKWDLTPFFDINKTEMRFLYRPNGNEIILKGLDEVDKIKSIHGITSFWHEEATELMPYDLLQMNLRLRGVTKGYKQHILTFNPISRSHWIKTKLFGMLAPPVAKYMYRETVIKTPSGPVKSTITILRTTYLQNPHNGPEYEAELLALAETDPIEYLVYALGEWGTLKNVIYRPYNLSPWPDGIKVCDNVGYGLDFGFRHPMCLLKFIELDGTFYEEELLYKSNVVLSNENLGSLGLIQHMRRFKIRPEEPIVADSAQPGSIEEICKAGFTCIPSDKGPGSVLDGIRFIQSLDIHGLETNENCIAERDSYQWRTDKNGEVVRPEAPVKKYDEAMDAERYYLYTMHRPRIEDREQDVVEDYETMEFMATGVGYDAY